MNAIDQAKLFEKELDDRIRDFARKRNRDKRKAFNLKIFAVLFAATITALLGLKVGDNWARLFQNVALLLGAAITVLNAFEAFYDHRSLWIRRTVTLARLYALKRDLDLYVVGVDQSDIDPETVHRLTERYDRILQDDLKAWLKLREGGLTGSEPSTKVATKDGG